MNKMMLNDEMLEKVNGGATIDDILNPVPYDPTLPIFNPDDIPAVPGNEFFDHDAIREALKKVINNYDTGYELTGLKKTDAPC